MSGHVQLSMAQRVFVALVPALSNHQVVLLGGLMAGWSDGAWWKAEPFIVCASVGRYFGARVRSSVVRNERLVR
jgi:hypothetical protein